MNKKSIFIIILAFLLSMSVVVIGRNPSSITAKIFGISEYNKQPVELYQVYLSGKSIGFIESKKELEDYIDSKQQQLKDKYHVDKIYAPNDLKIVKEITYNEKALSLEEIYKKIEEIRGKSSFTMEGYKIEIEGLTKKYEDGTEKKQEDLVFYVLDKEIFEKAVRKTINAFVDDETYEAYLNDTQKVLGEKETGSYIDNLYIENKIKITKGRIPAEDNIYVTEDEMSKFLLFGTLDEQEKYVVKTGDTIEDIANDNKLSVEEFLIVNSSFKSAQDLLYPGQEVNLGLITPQFDLVKYETVVSEKVHPKETVYKNDNSQYVGYEKVEEEGKDGLDLVTERRMVVNGEIKDLAADSNTVVLTPAINKVVVRGTKKREVISYTTGENYEVPVGIGQWAWPTNVPYTITSPFGWRWGKMHEGLDISGTGYNSPIKAANNGVVVMSTYNSTNGNFIIIKHENNYYSIYAHLASRYKQVGDVVMAGDQIGTMGMTGYATGVHLHFGIYIGNPWYGASAQNPWKFYK